MSAEPAQIISRLNRLRVDVVESRRPPEPSPLPSPGPLARAIIPLIAAFFVILGGVQLDLNATEAPVGLAASESIGPFGQIYGAWNPQMLPGRVLAAKFWTWASGEYFPNTQSVRWPAAIAAAVAILVLGFQASRRLGPGGGALVAIAGASSLAWVDHSAFGLGLVDGWFAAMLYRTTGSFALLLKPITPNPDFLGGLFTIAALCRMISKGPDLRAGLWAALAFLCGGWPPVVALFLVSIVLTWQSGGPRVRWLAPAGVTLVAWSGWAWTTARPDAWFAAMAWPLTQTPAWTLVAWSLVYAMPLGLFAIGAFFPSIRAIWSRPGRVWVMHWIQAAAAMGVAGTIIPGLGDAVRLPILAAMAVTAGASMHAAILAWPTLSPRARLAIVGAAGLLILPATIFGVPAFGYLAAAVPYYRSISLLLIALLIGGAALWITAVHGRAGRLVMASAIVFAISLKVAHAGVHAPEWNYRASQGPWGRAIGQWIPRKATLYFINPSAFDPSQPVRERWPMDLAFYTGRNVRQIPAAEALQLEPDDSPRFVLLHPVELENWPAAAPELIPVREMIGPFGEPRVLARTPGPLYADRRAELGE